MIFFSEFDRDKKFSSFDESLIDQINAGVLKYNKKIEIISCNLF